MVKNKARKAGTGILDEKQTGCPFKKFQVLLGDELEKTSDRYTFLLKVWETMPLPPGRADIAKKSLTFTDNTGQRRRFSLDDPSCLRLLTMVDLSFRSDEFWTDKLHFPFMDVAVLLTTLKRAHETGALGYDLAWVMGVKDRYNSVLGRAIGNITEITGPQFVRIYGEVVAYDCPMIVVGKTIARDEN
jgi:hypothetical protein